MFCLLCHSADEINQQKDKRSNQLEVWGKRLHLFLGWPLTFAQNVITSAPQQPLLPSGTPVCLSLETCDIMTIISTLF